MKLAIGHQTTRISDDSDYLFGRKDFAEMLKNIFNNSDSGFVLAIDATWGAGKTSFIHQLIHELKTSDTLIPIYYDAFANDFSSDTFLSIGATIFYEVEKHFRKLGENPDTDKQLDHLKKITKSTAIELVKLGTNLAVKSLTAGLINNADLANIANKAFNSATFGTLELDLNEKFEAYVNAKKNIQSYIDALESVSQNGEKVIFFIDELDRCRPDFAVELLEKVKHLFAAENVIFVISYNKSQLAKIVSSVYGVNDSDSLKYLEKFIHIEVNLPSADGKNDVSSYGTLFDSYIAEFNIILPNAGATIKHIKEMFIMLCSEKHLNMNIREIERAFSYVSLCFAALGQPRGIEQFQYFLPAAMIKVKNMTLFSELRGGRFFKRSSSLDNHNQWVFDFFEKYYAAALINQASNVFQVNDFKKACDIVSMFKLPIDEVRTSPNLIDTHWPR